MKTLRWPFSLSVLFLTLPGWFASANNGTDLEAPHRRAVFYAGGQYALSGTGPNHILVNQLYVEQLTPLAGKQQPYPLVFYHGGGISGTQWLNKPDGGRGWASWFLDHGYEVFLIDIWSVGRSSPETLDPQFAGGTAEIVEEVFTAPQLYNKYYQARFHTQWPGNGTMGDPVFDAFFARYLPLSFSDKQQTIMRDSSCALLGMIGPSILISHSLGSSSAFLASDGCPGYVKGHVSVEGDASPFASYGGGALGANTSVPTRQYGLTTIPVAYDPPVTNASDLVQAQTGKLEYTDGLVSKFPCIAQANTPPPRKLVNIAKAPVLYLTTEASIHVTYDQCSVQFLQQAGVEVNATYLRNIRIRGNGHFCMLEKNSDDIAAYIDRWIQDRVISGHR